VDAKACHAARVNNQGKPILFDNNEQLLIRKLRSVSRGNPQTLDFLSATVAIGEGDFELALELMERAKKTQTEDSSFQYHMGNVYVGLHRLEDGERSFREGLAIDQNDARCLMGLSRCYLEMERFEDASEMGRDAIGLQYHFPLGHYYYGLAQDKLRNHDVAIDSLQTALQQNPNFEEAHLALADIYRRHSQDPVLAEEHRLAAEEIAEQNRREQENAKPLDFSAKTLEEIAEHLPSLLDNQSNPDFEISLNQAKSSEPSEEASSEPCEVIIVSGLPRSGTSMMMQMLAAGGLTIFTDGNRSADESNPKGYYEADLVKGLATRNRWLHDCDGQVVKVVSPLVQYLPQNVRYKVIYMRRPITEIVRSQSRMLERLGEETTGLDDEQMGKVLRNQAHSAISLFSLHQNPLLRLAYADVLADPLATASAINEFLGMNLDETAMAQVVDPSLHREKNSPEKTASP